MSSPLAHSPSLPGDRPDKERLSCGKIFANLRTRHDNLMRYGHNLKEIVPVIVPHYLHLRRQSIKCPLCCFKSKRVKTPRSFMTHFSRHHLNYSLQISYTCSSCTEDNLDHSSPSTATDTCLTPSSPPTSLPVSTPPPESPASSASLTIVDTQNPMSPQAPSPPYHSPTAEVNASLMQRFLDACGETPPPAAPAVPVNPSTPSPAIPTLMANIIRTPSTDIPPTRQPPTTQPIPPLMANIIPTPQRPIAPAPTRPRAADFFNCPPPSMIDLPETKEPNTR